jgi:hypothetical protein
MKQGKRKNKIQHRNLILLFQVPVPDGAYITVFTVVFSSPVNR